MTVEKKTKLKTRLYLIPVIAILLLSMGFLAFSVPNNAITYSRRAIVHTGTAPVFPPDTNLRVPMPQPNNNPLNEDNNQSPFHLQDPPAIQNSIEYDPATNSYNFQNQIGNTPYGPGANMSVDEFIDYDLRQNIHDYWKSRGARYSNPQNRRGGGLIPQLKIGGDVFESIFGSNVIDIRPSGNAELIFGVLHRNTKNYALPIKQRRHTDFNFKEKIQLNLMAKIGDKIEFNLNYNTESNFDFDNKMKLKYEGKEDDIIQLIEFGDVALPLKSSLITGSQSLFGIKTQLKFGKLWITAVVSQQNAQKQTLTVSGGGQENKFYFKADEYEDNRHFFIGHFFRDHYNQYLSTLPLVGSPIVITKIEVWRTTIGAATTENRNIVAFTDLGENGSQFPGLLSPVGQYPQDNFDTMQNSLIRNISTVTSQLRSVGMVAGKDYEKVESARCLSSSEYTFNSKLGFISLNTALAADQVLAVAFQYTVIGDDHVYQVGEFSTDLSSPNCLRVKLLKSSNLNTRSPLWKLMMKNVYNLNTYQISPERFRLNILFTGDEEGIANGFFNTGSQKGIPLIRLMGMDRLNQQQDPYSDGIFDYIDGAASNGGTVESRSGRIYFPTIEPFGADLRSSLTEQDVADKYAFDSLYTMTKTMARQVAEKNKYYLEGSFKSSYGSEYQLGAFNVPAGSVKVTAGGITLQENIDYTVNYTAGTVTITNESYLKSGTPISISLENRNGMMNKKTMFGINLDYLFSKDFTVGATLLNLRERPYTHKVDYGYEPINNIIWGMNVAYKTKVPFVTKLVDFLPFHSTTAESNFQVNGEFAHFVPGHARVIGKTGVTFIDAFETAKSSSDLRNVLSWVLASTPQGQVDLFPEARTMDEHDPDRRKLAYGYNRAKLAWYVIDPIFYRDDKASPANLTKADLSRPYARAVYETEIFPYKQYESVVYSAGSLSVLNLAFYPTERGPYNYDVDGSEGFSQGVNSDGGLKNPETRWGGVMRKIDNTDFEALNYEYLEFWMMDPFIENPAHKGGKLYFNLGDISEDILRDGKKSFENGLPPDGSDENVEWTVWGRVPTMQKIVNGFDPDPNARQYQDVGYDGLQDSRERDFFNDNYLAKLSALHGAGSQAYQQAYQDPSSDNYHYFRGSDYDASDVKLNDRYKYYNNAEGNSPTDNQSTESYPTVGSSIPNVEDVNNDNTLSEDEKYYQYVVDLTPSSMYVGQNYINDIYEATPAAPLPDGSRPKTTWYQFRIPLKNPDKIVGGINGFNSIRFLRMFMKDFEEPIICRLATFELVRSDWRSYNFSLFEAGPYPPPDGETTQFSIATVNYEENSHRIPIPYTLPPGVTREEISGGQASYKINEQSLSLKVDNLVDGDARGVYKNVVYDMRRYKHLKMFVHAEDMHTNGAMKKGDISVFIRLGADLSDNYYEYRIPVDITPWGTRDSLRIWPEANQMDIVLDTLVAVKQRRNIAVRNNSHPGVQEEYVYDIENGNQIMIVGTPNLADVRTIMIGVRNPHKRSENDLDDMKPKSAEVWVDELRLTDFDEKSGFAAMGQARLNLADIGDVSFSARYSTPGFGTLESTMADRQKETKYSIDVATNIDGGKVLFPEKWNIKVPVHYDYSINMELPQYNPLNPDVKLKEDLKTYNTKAEKDSIKHMATAMVKRQNVNLMNVRKERNMNKPVKIRPWDVENLDFSYSYSETKKRDIDVEFDNEFIHEGQIGYTFRNRSKNYRPFSQSKKLKSKWLQLIKDLNFTPMPTALVIRTTLNRNLNTFKYRPKSQGNIIIDTSFVKNFEWRRDYSFQWDLTNDLKFDYQAKASARIDEPQGLIDTRTKRDTVWKNFGDGGRITTFNQRINATYRIPINKFPLFNWITADAGYTGTYEYVASALSLAYLGNTISNSNTMKGNVSINFVTLYNNVPYLKKVNQGTALKPKKPTTPSISPRTTPEVSPPTPKTKTGKDSLKKKSDAGKIILNGTVRFLMMLRNVSMTYTEGHATVLPGYLYSPNLFGIHFKTASPGFLYVFGGQTDIRKLAANGNWITKDTLMNTAFQQRYQQNITFRASIEPFKDVRIDVSAMRNYTKDFTEYFRADAAGELMHYSPRFNGTFSSSFFGLSTFFKSGTALFNQFQTTRVEIAKRLADANPNSSKVIDPQTGYPDGYGAIQQEVLTASFLSAYGGRNPAKIKISSPFTSIPLPNWRLSYNGFTKLKGINKYFQSLVLSHAYVCTYTVSNYTSDLNHQADAGGNPIAKNNMGNFLSSYLIGQVSIVENFSPLVGFDMTLKNSMMIKVNFGMTRNLAFSFVNSQLTEMTTKDFMLNLGYSFKNLKIGFNFSGMKRQVVSDLNLTAGFSIKDNMTVLRKLDEYDKLVSAGQLIFSINFSADYQISRMVGLRFYYDHRINKQHMPSSYDNSNLDCGISVRLMLSQ